MLLAAFLGSDLRRRRPLGIVCSPHSSASPPRSRFTPILALPALLSAPGDVPRTAAGMFTISYTCAIIVPTVSGALWDMTGKPWTAFVPLCVCAVVLTVLGT